jgi:hypothetical protein
LQEIKNVTPIVTNRADCNSSGELGSEQDRAPAIGDAGQWKNTPNDIIEIFPDGRREVSFRLLTPDLVPKAMAQFLGVRELRC